MPAQTAARQTAPDGLKEIVAALMCSPLYFELTPVERLNLIKTLAGPEPPVAAPYCVA